MSEKNDPPLPLPGQVVGKPLDAPTYFVSNAMVAGLSNDFTIVFNVAHPFVLPEGKMAPFGHLLPACRLQLSAQTLKDLTVILQKTVDQYEAAFGAIETTYTRSLEKPETK